jgi:diguanylate cyclase (GGDEF)-like protein
MILQLKSGAGHVAGVVPRTSGSRPNLTPSQQLAEARFLASFCCAVYGERDPKRVCATAAQWLHDYFNYRQAQFSFAVPEVQNVSFQPAAPLKGRDHLPRLTAVTPASMTKRSFSVAGGKTDSGYDITVQFPTGLGNLRLVQAVQVRQTASGDFLQGIGECLGSALEKALEYQKLQELSLKDSLTGLLNRRAFEELLDIEEERREDRPHSLIMIDIDNFKALNDRYGHPAGDQVIAGVAAAIKEALRGADLATRYGGEEYAVLLPGALATDGYGVAERIRQRIGAMTFRFGNRKVQVTASLGVAHRYAREDCDLHELLTQADRALYQAKRSGKNLTVLQHDTYGESPLIA